MDDFHENVERILDEESSLTNPLPHFTRLGVEVGKRAYEGYAKGENSTIDTESQEEYSRIIGLICGSFFLVNVMLLFIGVVSYIYSIFIPEMPSVFYTIEMHGLMLAAIGTILPFSKHIIPKKHVEETSSNEDLALIHAGVFIFITGTLLAIVGTTTTSLTPDVVSPLILLVGLWLGAEVWYRGLFTEEWRKQVLDPINHQNTLKKAGIRLLSREILISGLGIGILASVFGVLLDSTISNLNGAEEISSEQISSTFPFIGLIVELPIYAQIGGVILSVIGCLYIYSAAVLWLVRNDPLKATLYRPFSVSKTMISILLFQVSDKVLIVFLAPVILTIQSDLLWFRMVAWIAPVLGLYLFIPAIMYPYSVSYHLELVGGGEICVEGFK